jgi:glutathione synthase
MPRQLAVVMDPIGSIKIVKDSTFAMLLEAQRRGWTLQYVLPGSLGLRGGEAGARLAPLSVRDDPAGWFTLGEPVWRPLAAMDRVLMRKTRRWMPTTCTIPRSSVPPRRRGRG